MTAPIRSNGFLFPRNAESVSIAMERLRLVWAARSAIARTGRVPPSILRRVFGRDCDPNALRSILAASKDAQLRYRPCIRDGYDATAATVESFDAITVSLDMTDDMTERRALEYARTSCAKALSESKVRR